MRILNLYAGIGGNRKLWGNDHQITAVEMNEDIANVYQQLYPNDTVVVGDAHEYLLEHYNEFDFIWSSPPCQSHSIIRQYTGIAKKIYPDMKLYQEILFLKHNFKKKWVIENVKPYYKPLIEPSFVLQRHYFWSSGVVPNKEFESDNIRRGTITSLQNKHGISLAPFAITNKRQILRNCVSPTIGEYIFTALNS